MRRTRSGDVVVLVIGVLGGLIGCSRSIPTSPSSASPALNAGSGATGALPGWQYQGHLADGALGGYHLRVAGDAAELTPWRVGLANDDLYFLGIDAFLRPGNLKITGIRRVGTRLQLDWRFTHPFGAPTDFDAPPSAANRADLAIAARILFLTDVDNAQLAEQTFFTDVIANTKLITNPHGYCQSRGLLPAYPGNANTFPYQLVVDDGANAGAGNRTGLPNTTPFIGNYDPGVGGWQRSNAGFDRNAWTGYGILHQGQSATGSFAVNTLELDGGSLEVDLAVIAKYQDPRGIPDPRSKRLPAPNPDPFTFAYRMPHSALDVEWVASTGGGPIPGQDPEASIEVLVEVRDWDARAAVTSESDLSLDPQVNTVATGEPGSPIVEISTPGLSPIIVMGVEINPGTRTGLPSDEIAYRLTVTTTSAPEDGTYPALVRVTDPERNSPTRRDYTTDLAPGLMPITDPQLQVEPVTFMGTQFFVSSGPNNPPTCDGVVPSSGFLEPGGTFTVNLSQIIDDSTNLKVSMEYTGTANSQTSVVTIPYASISGETAFDPFTDSRLTQKLTAPTELGQYELTVHLDDNINQVDCGPFPFTVGIPGTCPTVGSTANSLGPFVWEDGINPDFVPLNNSLIEDFEDNDIGMNDLAGFRDDTGDLLVQGSITQQFWRWDYETDTGAALTSATYPGTGTANRAHTIEVDHNGRVLWVASNITQGFDNTGLETTEVYANAGTVVHFFDTNAGEASADKGTINVGQKVVAMAIDQFDNVWVVDSTNTMRKYTGPAGGTTYTEDTSVTFNLGTASGGVITGAQVEDFDIDFFNQAFFVLIRNGNAFNVWRFECNGTYSSSIQGGANPVINCFPGEFPDRGDIVIDNYGTNMTVLAGPQDAQIIVTADNGPGEVLAHDAGLIVTLTARMAKSAVEIGEDGAGRTTFLYASDLMVTTESLSDDQWCEYWVEVWIPPAGWQ